MEDPKTGPDPVWDPSDLVAEPRPPKLQRYRFKAVSISPILSIFGRSIPLRGRYWRHPIWPQQNHTFAFRDVNHAGLGTPQLLGLRTTFGAFGVKGRWHVATDQMKSSAAWTEEVKQLSSNRFITLTTTIESSSH